MSHRGTPFSNFLLAFLGITLIVILGDVLPHLGDSFEVSRGLWQVLGLSYPFLSLKISLWAACPSEDFRVKQEACIQKTQGKYKANPETPKTECIKNLHLWEQTEKD